MAKSKVTVNRAGKSRVRAPQKAQLDAKLGKNIKNYLRSGISTKARKLGSSCEIELESGIWYLSADGLVDVDQVAITFGMTKASLAQSLGFADDTLQRFSRATAPKTQQRLREMLEILTRVERWAGGLPQALGWYRGQGIPALGDQTAESLVRNEQAAIVRRYLDGLAAGSFA